MVLSFFSHRGTETQSNTLKLLHSTGNSCLPAGRDENSKREILRNHFSGQENTKNSCSTIQRFNHLTDLSNRDCKRLVRDFFIRKSLFYPTLVEGLEELQLLRTTATKVTQTVG
jgi:hypothetical protein